MISFGSGEPARHAILGYTFDYTYAAGFAGIRRVLLWCTRAATLENAAFYRSVTFCQR